MKNDYVQKVIEISNVIAISASVVLAVCFLLTPVVIVGLEVASLFGAAPSPSRDMWPMVGLAVLVDIAIIGFIISYNVAK